MSLLKVGQFVKWSNRKDGSVEQATGNETPEQLVGVALGSFSSDNINDYMTQIDFDGIGLPTIDGHSKVIRSYAIATTDNSNAYQSIAREGMLVPCIANGSINFGAKVYLSTDGKVASSGNVCVGVAVSDIRSNNTINVDIRYPVLESTQTSTSQQASTFSSEI